jgi:hypothetical protein
MIVEEKFNWKPFAVVVGLFIALMLTRADCKGQDWDTHRVENGVRVRITDTLPALLLYGYKEFKYDEVISPAYIMKGYVVRTKQSTKEEVIDDIFPQFQHKIYWKQKEVLDFKKKVFDQEKYILWNVSF